MPGISLAAVGDIMLGDHPVCFGHGIRSAIRRRGFEYMVKSVAAQMRGHDVVFGNLECVLSDVGADERSLKKSELRGDKAAVGLLQACGVNVVSVANNHMLQHGAEAFQDNLTWLAAHGVRAIGVYDEAGSNVATFEKDGEQLAMLSFSLRPEHFCKDNRYYAQGPRERILEQVRKTAQEVPGRSVVVSLHWGEEYLHVPSREQIDFAHELIDNGATLIVGHHPHVLQGIERYRSGLIAYSLGNFLFDSWQSPTREGGILQCTLERGTVRDYKLVPLFIESDYTLSTGKESRTRSIEAKVSQYSRAIAERSDLAALDSQTYAQVAEKVYFRYRLECYWYFIAHFWKYSPRILFTSLFRSVLRRAGLA